MKSRWASPAIVVAAVVALHMSFAQVFSPQVVAAGGRSEEPPATTVRLGYGGTTDAGRNPAHSFAAELQREVAARSEGRLSVLLFPDNQLGSPRELIDEGLMNDGNATDGEPVLTIAPAAVVEGLVPEFRAASIPFLFPDRDAARRFYRDSEFFERAGSLLEEAAGARVLEVVEVPGAVGFSNAERPLRSPADFSGLAFATEGGRYAAVVRAFGAEAVAGGGDADPDGDADADPDGDADESGDADGWVGTSPELLAAGLHTRFTFRSEVGLAYPMQYLLASGAALEGLSADERRIIVAAAAAAGSLHGDRAEARGATVHAALEAAGVEFFVPGPMEREELRRIAQPAYIDELEQSISLEWITLALDGAAESNPAAESDQ